MNEWNEDKYDWAEEYKKCAAHDCAKFPDECDFVHPNIAKNVMAVPSMSQTREQAYPKQWREWMRKPKVIISYYNQHFLRNESFNMTEIFNQMNTNAKLNVFHNMFEHLLDEDEKSLFLGDIMENMNDKDT